MRLRNFACLLISTFVLLKKIKNIQMLTDLVTKLNNKKNLSTEKSTVDRVFELYQECGKNESGQNYVFVKKEEDVKKNKK